MTFQLVAVYKRGPSVHRTKFMTQFNKLVLPNGKFVTLVRTGRFSTRFSKSRDAFLPLSPAQLIPTLLITSSTPKTARAIVNLRVQATVESEIGSTL